MNGVRLLVSDELNKLKGVHHDNCNKTNGDGDGRYQQAS
jgi:hypothetical protein